MRRIPMALMLLFFATYSHGADSKVEEIIKWQRSNAIPRTMYIPYYSVEAGHHTDIYMVLKIMDPLLVAVTAIANGEQMLLGEYTVQPSRGATINLREALGGRASALTSGVLRLDYVGNVGTLQAWAVVRNAGQLFEVPFITSAKIETVERISFWDIGLIGAGSKRRVEYHLANAGSEPTGVTLEIHSGRKPPRVESFRLNAAETRQLVVSDFETTANGWLRLVTEPASTVIGAGVYRDGIGTLAYSALVPRADAAQGPRFEALRLPVGRDGRAKTASLALFNTGTSAQNVRVELIRAENGSVVNQSVIPLTVSKSSSWTSRASLAATFGMHFEFG